MKEFRCLYIAISLAVALGAITMTLAWVQPAVARVEAAESSEPLSPSYSALDANRAAPSIASLNPSASSAEISFGNNLADAPYGVSPTLDGQIEPGEYAGAYKLTFPTYGGVAEAFIIQDVLTLYIAIDSPDSAPYAQTGGGGGPAFQVFLDTLNDKASTPQTDDYRLTLSKDNDRIESQGNSIGWSAKTTDLWSAAFTTSSAGWQSEFGISLTKLGISHSGPMTIGLSLAEVWTLSWPYDWGWPGGWSYSNPSTWGTLISSSEWGTMYWKPGPWLDYAPSGMPDFDQRQDEIKWPYVSGPTAAANSLWWFDSKYETRPTGPEGTPNTLPISDTYTLLKPFDTWDDHDPSNVAPLINDLADKYFNSDETGTDIVEMYDGLQAYLRSHDLWDDYIVSLVKMPDFSWIAEETMRSEDVILLLGFWQQLPTQEWVRIGGHYVTVAGVDPTQNQIAFSDSLLDQAEVSGIGRVLSGTLITHSPLPGHSATVHNDAGNISHDLYAVLPGSPGPGGTWWVPEYEPPLEILKAEPGLNPNPDWIEEPLPYNDTLDVHTEIEYALTVSPFDWKSSGRWVADDSVPIYAERFDPYLDFAPSGMPDFDQRQDNWQASGQWSFCGPAAVANSLWWFDSKFELAGAAPPTILDHLQLVEAYDPTWDDHDPQNADSASSSWPPSGGPPVPAREGELIEDLALYFQTDQLSAGTLITDAYTGIQGYLSDRDLLEHFSVSKVQAPSFWWAAEEVERSEDVILLLGFYALDERVGGHYINLAGVNKQGGYVAFSDPYWDNAETTLWPYSFSGTPNLTGRVGSDGEQFSGGSGLLPLFEHTPLPHPSNHILHNDSANVSHDIYQAIPISDKAASWGVANYVTTAGEIVNFTGLNGGGIYPGSEIPVETHVEWALAVSPLTDVSITKRAEPAHPMPGDWITYTLAFSNANILPAEDVVVSDPLPSLLTNPSWDSWLSNGGGAALRGGDPNYAWDIDDLGWGESGLITITAQIDPAAAEIMFTNSTTITTSGGEADLMQSLPNSDAVTIPIGWNLFLPIIKGPSSP